MARPVVLRANPVTALVLFLVIPAQSLEPGGAAVLVKPHLPEQAPCSVDTLHRRALALVRHRANRKARRTDMILISNRGDSILLCAVMRQDALSVAIASGAQPFEV